MATKAAALNNQDLAALIKRCAQALVAAEEARATEGKEYWKGLCGEWSSTGRKICEDVAGPVWGEIVYYLLGGAWNDVVDWAEAQEKA